MWAHFLVEMAPFILILFSMRKIAMLPAATVSLLALGAAFGSFNLARKSLGLAFPPKGAPRPGSDLVAGGASLTVASFLVAIREVLFAPTPVPPPALPLGGLPLMSRLRNAALLSKHSLLHYPYRFRFVNACIAGAGAGATWACVERTYAKGPTAAAAAVEEEEHVAAAPPAQQ